VIRRIKSFALIVFSVTFPFLLATQSYAQGMVITPDQLGTWTHDPYTPSEPISIESETIDIDVEDQFARVKISQVFRNNTPIDLEGIYMFPLPPNANISNFSLWLDDVELTSEMLGAVEANTIYQNIVATMRDPGLLEYVGDGLIRAHIYPIPANGTKKVDMYYDWLLPLESGLISLNLPLKLDGFSIQDVKSLAITVNISSASVLGSIYSPTHEVEVVRNGSRRAVVGFEKGAHRPVGDFVLYISRPGADIGLNMLTSTSKGDEGYFLALIAPEYDESKEIVTPKDFVFVLDKSGSMSGYKIDQAKEALNFIYQNLNSDDRFSLVTFATEVYSYNDVWLNASWDNIKEVRDYIDGIEAGGNTNFEGAVDTACKLRPGEDRPLYIIILSDGLPTVGNTDTNWLIDHTSTLNSELNARIFCFGVGDDVDYQFIDRLARENGGYTSSVGPSESLEQPLSEFYAKIKSPVMTNLVIEIDGTRIYDLLPDKLPDLFLGSQLVLSGRYAGEGYVDVCLTGKLGGEEVTFDWSVLIEPNESNDFIPRHWATRRVGNLLNEIRLYGETDEVRDEIIALATQHGIITPYTSMLVTEDIAVPLDSFTDTDQFGNIVGGGGFGGAGGPSAPSAQSVSVATQSMEKGEYYGQEEMVQEFVQYQGNKVFYQNAELYWVDSEFDDEIDVPIQITYMSDEYFDLIDEYPDIAEFLSVGEQVIFVFEGQAYQVNPAEDE